MTTGQSVSEYKKEIERHGGRVTAAIFYGKTVEVPPLFTENARLVYSGKMPAENEEKMKQRHKHEALKCHYRSLKALTHSSLIFLM